MQNSDRNPEQEAYLKEPLPLGLIQQLFVLINVSVQPGELSKAWEQLSQELPSDTTPPQRIQQLIQRLQLRGLRVAQLRWSRMDQRRLPALMFVGGVWQLAERQLTKQADNQSEEDLEVEPRHQVSMTRSDGLATLHAPDELEDGIVLWVENPRVIDEDGLELGKSPSVRMLFKSLFKTRRWIFDIAAATVVINLLAVATSLFAMQVYDRVVPTLAYATLWTLVVGMAIVTALDWVLKLLRARVLDSLACEVDQDLSARVFDHLMRLQLDTRPRSLGTMAAQVGGLESVRQFFSSSVIFALVDMPFAILFLFFIAIIGGPIAWVYGGLLPIAILLGWYGQARLKQLTKQEMMRSNERQGVLVDAIQGTESIRTANASWRFNEQWQEISKTVAGYSIRQKALNNGVQTTTGSLSSIAYVAAIVVGVALVADGRITMGAMIACSILGGRVIGPIGQGVRFLSQWQNVRQALNLVDQVLELKTERREGQTLLMPIEPPHSVELESVTFSYPESPVKQLDIPKLQLKAGDRVVLLGQIGSGKSTLLKVLAGMYRPSEGRIRLGYGDLWEIDPVIIARDVAYLPQSVHMFKGTLRSNLTLGGAISDSHLLEVAQKLGIDAIAADSPYSMDLSISEGGDGLSGGQKQLVGLGRVFLARPRIWLLDEPSASLDPEAEQRLMAAIKEEVKPSDILVISTHKASIASQLANRVMVMRRGEIIADGPPEQILAPAPGTRPRPANSATTPKRGANQPEARPPGGQAIRGVSASKPLMLKPASRPDTGRDGSQEGDEDVR